ncbi:MAG TPA: helicase-related protein, partial [Acetobacteraceae bacterium]
LLILVHRDELVSQWIAAAALVLGDVNVSLVNADVKDWSGRIVVAMVPTACRPANLDRMPDFDMVAVDEAHHVVASTWMAVLDAVRRRRPDARIYGCTATPERGDKKGLRRVFSNVSFALPLPRLVEWGFLVEPRAFAFDIAPPAAVDRAVRDASDFGQQDAVAELLNTPAANERAVELWAEKAGDRRTIAFASNVAHAMALEAAWKAAGVAAETLTGETPRRDRAAILERLASGETQVVANCAVLTEGFDEPMVGCAVLARGCSNKSLLIQMAGRALRTVDAGRHPGVVKKDAVIIDFGRSLARHGDLLAGARLDDAKPGEAPTKTCPSCDAVVPLSVTECPLCGHEFQKPEEEAGGKEQERQDFIRNAKLFEIDVLNRSPFAWETIAEDAMIAAGFKASAAVKRIGDVWVAVGYQKRQRAEPLRVGHRYQALSAADDYLRTHEDSDGAHKTAAWLSMRPTEKQVELLAAEGFRGTCASRYAASARIEWAWNSKRIIAASLQAVRGK